MKQVRRLGSHSFVLAPRGSLCIRMLRLYQDFTEGSNSTSFLVLCLSGVSLGGDGCGSGDFLFFFFAVSGESDGGFERLVVA